MSQTLVHSHRGTNALHTLLLLACMGLLMLVLGYALAGRGGAAVAAGFGVFALWVSPRIAPNVIMRLYGARALYPGELPALENVLAALTQRSGLASVPRLYYVPSQVMNAFTVGDRERAAIGVTDGLLRALNLRELTGVLAHEVSHLRNNDLRVMTLADMVSRMTTSLSFVGQLLLLINLPLLLMGRVTVPWLLVLLLLAAPSLATLLQLALSRTREHDADIGAYELTGDARGLASALAKMERYQRRFLDLVVPGRKIPDPSLLRTHPNAEERIERLLRLEGAPPEPVPETVRLAVPVRFPRVEHGPRWHWTGLWY
ncbi:MAG TPA: zinc metalloprotease HtpX [Vicinamibacteria bacterium]|nr:zinc metalloprotease HtpX [Vicinamibacteria bacterium]